MSELPRLDLAVLSAPGADLSPLRRAATEVGFFTLIATGPGTMATDQARMLALVRAFFALPEAERVALANLRSPHFRGWTRVGTERTAGAADQREQLDVGLERPARAPAAGDPPWWRLEGPNQWPDVVLPELRPAVLDWVDRLSAVAARLLGLLLASLDLPPDLYADAFATDASSGPHVHAKLIRYPAVAAVPSEQADLAEQGVGAHKDYGFLTLLLQDDAGGLQVTDRAGRWHDVAPAPGFVVNLGEMLEVATAGLLLATTHRVVSPTRGDRVSLPVFYNPRLDAIIEPAPLPPALRAAAPGVTDDPDNPLLASYGANAWKGWLRAHPEVARRHHADLLTPA